MVGPLWRNQGARSCRRVDVGGDKLGGCLDKYATCGVGGSSSSGILLSMFCTASAKLEWSSCVVPCHVKQAHDLRSLGRIVSVPRIPRAEL